LAAAVIPCDHLAAMVGFDPKTATEAEIIHRAESLPGRLVGSLEDLVGGRSGQGKGDVGLTVERFFGIVQNALSEPDFPAAGIELKVVPLVHRGGSLRVKERTVISMIDYNSLVLETWTDAHVRRKLHILFVFFEHLPAESKTVFPIREVLLWSPDAVTGALLRADWERVRIKVRQGRAAELSESDGRVLGPCTKGTDSTTLRDQPFSSVRAKSRAFALKPAFTFHLYRDAVGRAEKVESLAKNIGLARFDDFERVLLSRFDRYLGRAVGDVADELKIPPSDAKSYAAAVVRRIFGAKDFKSKIIEFEDTGLMLRVSRVTAGFDPYESLSFPAFVNSELLEESWEDSDLLSRVEYMLLIPVIGKTKGTRQAACALGAPVFWRPDVVQIETIRREYEIFRTEIRIGHADRLTPASATSIIHVRPHARNARDTDVAPVIGPVIKKSFWINKGYVGRILRQDVPGTIGAASAT
jgi:DNA mismatch repair protein MutH